MGLHINQRKTKHMIVEWRNGSKQNKIGQLTIKNYTFERVENFKYLGVMLNEDNKHQIDLQERIKNEDNKHQIDLQERIKNEDNQHQIDLQERIKNEDNKRQIDLQERIKNANKTYFIIQKCFRNKDISKNYN